MKLKRIIIGFAIVWAFHMLFCTGCASKQVKITLDYTPDEKGLLSDLRPAIVSLQVIDQRPNEQRNSIGIQRGTMFGDEKAVIVSKIPEVKVVHNAIKSELEKSGHRVSNPGQGYGEKNINVKLTQFFINSRIEDINVELIGSIRADVIVSSEIRNVPQISFSVNSTYRDYVRIVGLPAIFGVGGIFTDAIPKSELEKIMNGALAEFVTDFCQEPKLHIFLSN